MANTLTVQVHITGLDATKQKLAQLSASFNDFTEVLTSLGATLIKFYGDTNFNDQGRDLFGSWTPLATSTLAEKDKNWPGRGILQRTGRLQDSFFQEVTPNSLFISNDARTPDGEYSLFEIHQLGTNRAGRKRNTQIPARPMLGINDAIEAEITTAIHEDVTAKIEALK